MVFLSIVPIFVGVTNVGDGNVTEMRGNTNVFD
jgi:hypothetical protein